MRIEPLLIIGLLAGCTTLDPNSTEYRNRKAKAMEKQARIDRECAYALANSIGGSGVSKVIYLFDNGKIYAVCRQ